MLESEGLQTWSLQKIQMPGDSKPTPVFIDTSPAQRIPASLNTIPVKEVFYHLTLFSKREMGKKHVENMIKMLQNLMMQGYAHAS